MPPQTEVARIINDLEIYLNNVNILSTCKTIKQFINAFKSYLNICAHILPQIEQPGHTYSLKLQNQLIAETDKFLLVANELENTVPLEAKLKIRDIFRGVVGEYLFQSQILKRYYDKPRGYAGDYLMFEMMYDAKPLSRGLGVYFDYYVFRHSIVESVVNRKARMKKVLANILRDDFKDENTLKVLNIGCGGARDVVELFSENIFSRGIDFTLMDQDSEGLEYAQTSLNGLCKKKLKFHFIKKNALEMIGLTKNPIDTNSYHVIYSLGIVDYFLDNVFSRFIKRCYDLLKPNGKLIIAACSDRDLTTYIALRWLSEWNFYYRAAKSVKGLVNEMIENANVEIKWEDNKKIFFIHITKI